MSNPYEILGISKSSSEVEIKSAYRALAKRFHPDHNPDNTKAEEKFKEISGAYETLSDPEKRQMYDTYGHTDPKNIDPFEHIRSNIGFDFRDIFSGNSRQSRMQGDDIKKSIEISFMEAVKGCSKKISIDYVYPCSVCDGNGSEDGKNLEACKVCQGSGRVGTQQGFIQILHSCPSCSGQGSIILKKCKSCIGSGKTKKIKKIKVTIPAGIEPNTVMRLTGKGMPSAYAAANGDLYLITNVMAHPEFNRSGPHIYTVKEISYINAILGTKVIVKTIHGDVKVKIPNGTQPESILRIESKGVITKNFSGDHMVKVIVKIPEQVSAKDKEILEKLKVTS